MSNGNESHTEVRPWGEFTVLLDAHNVKVKRIIVKAGKRLSLQSHQMREEHWTVVSGQGEITLGATRKQVYPGDVIYVPKDVKHRVQAIRSMDLTFIEVQLGTYFGEDDIERFEDDYGRTS